MKVVVTFFTCDDGHLGCYNPITQREELLSKIKEEAFEKGFDWLRDADVIHSFHQLDSLTEDKLLELCENLVERGHLNVVEIPTVESNVNQPSQDLLDELGMTDEISKYADVFPIEDFVQDCKDGLFINGDGFGNPVMGNKMNGDVDIYPSMIRRGDYDKRYTHIAWYNK